MVCVLELESQSKRAAVWIISGVSLFGLLLRNPRSIEARLHRVLQAMAKLMSNGGGKEEGDN